MSEIVQVGGNNYTIPDQGDPPNWGTNLTPFFVALAAEVATAPAFYQGVAVASTPITVGTEQTYLVASNSITATLNLPAPVQNLWFAVKDSGKNCAVNNITIHRYASESINGVAADKVLSLSGGFWMFGCDGTNWFMLRDVEALNPYKTTNQLVITPSNGLISTTLSFPVPSASRVITIGDPGADANVIVSAGAQSIGGVKTFSATPIFSAGITSSAASTFNAATTFAAAALFSDGLVGTPAITFTNDPDTGIYRIGSNQVAIVAGGVAKLFVDSAGGIVCSGSYINNSDGVVGAPAYSFSAGGTDGMYRIGTNDIGFATNGVLRVDISTTNVTSTLPWLAPNGAVNLPALSFSGDPDCGLYRIGANDIALATNGTKALEIDATQHSLFIDGTVGAPAIAFASDTDCGLYHIGTNAIGLATNGTVAIQIDATQHALFIDGTVGAPGVAFASDTDCGIYRIGANDIAIATGGAKALEFNTTQEAIFTSSFYNTATTGTTTIRGLGPSDYTCSTVQNSKTMSFNTSAIVMFWIYGGSGDGCLVVSTWATATITIVGTGGSIVASSTPSASQIGIFKSAGSHTVSIKAGSSATGTNTSITIVNMTGVVSGIVDWA